MISTLTSAALSVALLAPAGPVDWANLSYTVDGTTYTLTNGSFERQPEDGVGESLELTGVVSGDLDGDGQPEHLVSLVYWGGGTGRFDELYVYRVAGKTPLLAGRILGGDRGDGGHGPVKIVGDAVRLERNASLPWDGVCCPSLAVVEHYRWIGGALVRDVERSGIVSLGGHTALPAYDASLKAARAAMTGAERNPQKAIEHLLLALEKTPGDPVALGELGFAMMAEKVPEAEAALWAAANSKGKASVRAAALYNLGKLYVERGDRARAVDAAQRSLVLRPGNKPTAALLDKAQALAAAK